MQRQQVDEVFRQYTSAYNADDPKIKLKIDHTFRVAMLAETIAKSLGGADADLAWLCGMLHDIGRFEQVRRFHTFFDADSVDHARFGADLLFQEGLLERFALDLSEKEKRILEVSIRNHNAYRVQEGLTEEEYTYCNILRDADKIDIFRVNCDTPLEEIYNVTTEELRNAGVSKAVRQCYFNRTAVRRDCRQTAADYVVAHICLVFELVYPISRQIAKEQGYVDRLLDFPSWNETTQEWFSYMRDTIWKEKKEYQEYENDKKYIDYWIREVLDSSDVFSQFAFSMEDLQQRAWLELLRASERYDPERGAKLTTYAKTAVQRGIREEAVFQINRAGITGKEYVGPTDSISIDDEENGIADRLAAEAAPSGLPEMDADAALRDGLKQITETERAVLYTVYGIGCERCTNLKKVAGGLGMTEQETRRALESGKRKLLKFTKT